VRRFNSGAALVTARYQLQDAVEAQSGRRVPVTDLAGRRLMAFAGLGSPQGFADTLDAAGVRRVLEELAREAHAASAQGLVTTEKDWVRVRDLPRPALPLWVLPMRLVIDSGLEAWQRLLAGTLAPAALGRPRS
jgi:tetraacyldisaccharide-1-P 4'-kinase